MSGNTENQPDEDSYDVDFVPDSPELCLADGETWFADSVTFCERHDLEGLQSYDGRVWGMREGVGRVSLDDLLKESAKRKTSKLVAITRGSDGKASA